MQIAAWKFGCRSPHSVIQLKGALSEKVKTIVVARPSIVCLLDIVLALGGLSCGLCPRPFVSSISPGSKLAGGNQFVLTINGSDFLRDSLVSWNGSFLVTGFVSSHQLVVTIPAADIAQPGMVLVFVFNPANGNTTSFSGAIGNTSVSGCAAKDSNAVVFTINP
jgi:hypothetical protein